MGAAMGVGMIFGPMLGGLLTGLRLPLPESVQAILQVTTDPATGNLINLSIPFFASALLALLDLVFISILLPESLPGLRQAQPAGDVSMPEPVEGRQIGAVQSKTTRTVTGKQSRFGSLLDGLRGPSGFLFALAFLLAFALANMESVLALYGGKRFAMGPAEVGLLMGALGLTSVIGQGALIGPLTRRFGEEHIIQAGLIIGIAGFLGMAVSGAKWALIASTLVFNIGNVFLAPSVTSLVSKRARTGQGEAMGLNNSFQALGRAAGPLWAGFAFDIYSTLSFWTGALIQGIALFYSARFFGRPVSAAQAPIHEAAPTDME